MRSTPSRSAQRARWIALGLAGLALATLPLASCRDPYPQPRYRGAGATTPHRGGTLRYAIDSDYRSLDPHVGYDAYSGSGIRLMYETLVQYAVGSTELEPGLATRWELSADGREYTFHLRPGVRFTTGREMSAEDVRRSFERMLDPRRVQCPATSFYRLLEGFDAFQAHRAPHVTGIEVVDPLTIRFRLTQPDQTFLNAMAMNFASPVDVDAADRAGPDNFSQHPAGTGPYTLEAWERGARAVFRRNNAYWRPGFPYLDRIVVDVGVAPHLQFMRFVRGEMEFANNLTLSTADYLWMREHRAWEQFLTQDSEISMYGLAMNCEMAPFDNVHVRRAVAASLDRETIARARHYRIRPLGGLYPPGLPAYDANLPGAQHLDLDLARREMALAGHPNGIPAEFDLWIADEGASVLGQLVQADLLRIGLHARIRSVSYSTFLHSVETRHTVQMAFTGWMQDFPDPADFAEILFHSRNATDEEAQNQTFYRNAELDALLDRARIELVRERRLEMYRQAERMIVADAPWAFMFNPTNTEVVQPYVRGYRTHPVYTFDVGAAWLDLPLQRYSRAPANGLGAALAALSAPWRSWR